MKHYFHWLLLCVIPLLTGCSDKNIQITNLSMLKGGKTVAVPTGTVADQFVLQKFPDAKIKYFNSTLDCAIAVKSGKADAAAYDKPILQNIAAKNDGLVVLSELLIDDQYGFAVQPQNRELKTTIDAVLAELKSNGTYDDMMRRWFPVKGNPAPMPKIRLIGKKGVFKFGTAAVTEPMSFMDANKNIVGFDVEFATYIARKLGKKLEIVDMEFGAMLPALIAGKVDMIGAGLSITEERAKKVLFSESYYPSGIAVMVREKIIPTDTDSKFSTIDDIKDKRIGVLLGSIHDSYATQKYPDADILQYQSISDMLIALNSGKVDVAFFDQAALNDVFSANEDIGLLADNVYSVPIAAGFNMKNDKLRAQFNYFLRDIKSNGIYDDMVDRWMKQNVMEMPEIKSVKTNGSLKVGVVNDLGMPFSILKEGKIIGFDIELAERFAAYIGKEFIPVDMQFGSMLASLSTNKIDIITSSLIVTDERKKQIDFSDPYYESGVSLIALKKNITPAVTDKMSILDDIADKKIGVFTGTIQDGFIAQKYPHAKIYRFESTADLMMSVKSGKIDAAMFDLITAKLVLKRNPELGILSDDVLSTPLGVGFNKKDSTLRDEFNDYLKEIRQDGTYEVMRKRWFIDDAESAVMPPFTNPVSDKKLVVGVSVEDLPYVAFMNGDYVGLDIEMIHKFAERRNYQLEIIQMEFSSLVAALAAGKVDMISDGISISEERAKQIDFSDSYADFRTAVVAPKKNIASYHDEIFKPEKKSFLQSISNSFYSNIILENRYLLIIDGLKITTIISIFAAIVGTLLGGLICFMRMSKRKILSVTAIVYITLLRGTPVLVFLMIIYYVVFASVNINPVIVAVFAFGLNFGAYVSEMFRTSIESIDKGQKEAGIAGGFTKIQTFIHIIMPQALRHVLPVYKGEFISLVKMTSIVGYIAVQDLTKAGDIIRSRTFDAFFPLIMAAVLYLIIAWLLTWALGYIEISVDPKRKRIVREVEVD
ncbi:MAG: ABC transporter permease subunit [Candidatus Neomarinimicrobiota bacterium]